MAKADQIRKDMTRFDDISIGFVRRVLDSSRVCIGIFRDSVVL